MPLTQLVLLVHVMGNNTSNVGCTNSLAGNYNPNATQDDGSCDFYYCTDSSALNYVCIDEPSLCDQSGASGTFDTSLGTLLPSNQALFLLSVNILNLIIVEI
jgi:hypothetical protein